jgi:anaerobic magnesium-protoporphyrin IX monomethyl ester cyclase
MKRTIDCLLIGHNEMRFADYEQNIRSMGLHTGAYRDLNLNLIWYQDKPLAAAEAFNLFGSNRDSEPLDILKTLSPTIAYLGTFLQRRGFSFAYVNAFQAEKERLAALLKEADVLTAAITTTLYTSVFPILEIVDFVRRANPGVKIVLGGPFVATQVRSQEPGAVDFLFHTIGADFYVNSSQGEATLVHLIRSLKQGTPPHQIPNLYYKDGGGYRSTAAVPEDNKLSENMVNWELFAHRLGDHAAIRTSISCPFACSFCNFPEYAGPYQPVDIPAIEQELDQLRRIETVTSLHFIDDTFNVPVKRFKEILRLMIRNKYTFRWHSYLRCQFADEEMAELMKAAGCEGVYLGLESGSDQILKNMNKAVRVEEYLRGIGLLKRYGLLCHGNFIVGFPGETPETVRQTVRLIEESGLDFFRVQLWYCLHVTEIWRQRQRFGIKGESFEWSHATMDSKTAADFIDRIFLSIDGPTWLPQYNFDVVNLWHMIFRGLPLPQVKSFIRAFNRGIKERLQDPAQKNIDDSLARELAEPLAEK